jgi:hypothetical protein
MTAAPAARILWEGCSAMIDTETHRPKRMDERPGHGNLATAERGRVRGFILSDPQCCPLRRAGTHFCPQPVRLSASASFNLLLLAAM